MKHVYSLIIAALLFTTTMLAQNVAKVTRTADGTPVGEYPTMAEALAAWTDGTTLTMLDNATYTATATYTVVGAQTLDLAGKTLTWDADANATNVISLGANAALSILDNTAQKGVLSFTTAAKAAKVFDVNASTKALNINGIKVEVNATGTGDGRVIYAGNSYCVFSIANTDFAVQNNVKRILETGIYSGEGVCQDKFENVAVDFAANCTLFGIQAFRTGRASFALQDCEIDMSKLTGNCRAIYLNKKCDLAIVGGRYIVGAGRPANSVVEFSSNDGSSCSIKKGTAEPVFDAPIFITLPNPVSILKKNKANVECGKFFTSLLPYTMAPEGKHFEQKTENGKSYYMLEDGAYVLGLQNTLVGYTDAQKCISEANDVTINVLSSADFTIPADKKFTLLNESSNKSLATITNEGNITISTAARVVKGNWNNFKIVNKGSLKIGGLSTSKPNTQMYVDNVTIENEGTLTLTGYPTLEWEIHYGKDFKIDNKEGGSVSVSSGFFATDAKSQIENYLAEGYSLFAFGNGYRVAQQGAMVAQVGTVQYNDLAEALEASSENEYAKLLTSFPYTAIRVNGRNAYLDLNGKTLTLTSGDSFVENGSLTIKNGTLNCTEEFVFDMYGSTNPTVTNYSVLNIESNVTITQAAGKGYFAAVSQIQKNQPYGMVVNFNGTYEGQCPFYIQGALTTISDNAPTFNIGSTATFTANSLAYAAGYGIWNYAGTATTSHHGFELRAGKLNVTGGKIVCTSDAPADDQGNGSGSTSQASAIAACQHSTKLPVEINISGGEFEAYTPLYQANPQKNPQEAYEKVKVIVTGGMFKATKGSKNIVWSANKRIVLNGGVYNLSPSQYAADGKVVVANPDPATNDLYPYTIGEQPAGISFDKEGNWNVSGNWSDNKGATSATPVIIAANVVIPNGVTAEAYGITVAEGKTITIKAGGKLLVGKEGIAGLSGADQLKIEDGGILAISPAAESNNQPQASVVKSLNTYKKAAGTYVEGVEDEYVRCYMGGVTIAKPQVKKDYTWFGNYWDYRAGWQETSLEGVSILCEPFKGFAVATASASAPATPVTMQGTLVGNADAHMSMPGEGFHFFANSWMAPLDAYEVLNQLDKLRNEGKVESSIKILLPLDVSVGDDDWSAGTFVDINRNFLRLGNYSEYWGTIAPMAGFFLRANEPVNIDLTYENAVWNALQVSSSTPSKSVRRSSESAGITGVQIRLTASDGSKDRLYVFNGDPIESCTKMMNDVPNVNIYVANAGGKYSTYATEDLSGTEIGIQSNSSTEYVLSFGYTEGEILYLKDLQTGIVTEMSDGNSYIFTADANTTTSRFRIVSRSEVTTGVDGTTAETTAATAKGIYSVTGQYLGDADQQSALPAGVYIINGKKVVK